jgi:hypothetical protein
MVNGRNKGNAYERMLAQEYRDLGFCDCVTSRSESKRTDDKGIDLCYTDPFAVQAKNYTTFSSSKIIKTLDEMDTDTLYPLVHLKITRAGEIVALKKSDWYEILGMMRSEYIIK